MFPLPLFTIATLTPALLITCAALWGGFWVALSVVYLTVLTSLLDRMVQSSAPSREFPAGDGLAVALALAHFTLLPVVVLALAGDGLGLWEKAGLFFAAGLFMGQISNSNSHELIHRRQRFLHRLGMWVYITLLFGHHTSSHVLVHHRHVATAQDPSSARRGEGFYRFARRAWLGSFQQGYRAEAARLARIGRPAWRNPYLTYLTGQTLCLGLAALAGPLALTFYVGLVLHAQMQLLLSDYVQHYGLTRSRDASGRAVPVGAQHSWNSPHWFSSALMLNGTRHSDHHAHPARPYPALTIPEGAPILPRPLPMMASIALAPPLWRRIMDPALERWTDAQIARPDNAPGQPRAGAGHDECRRI